MTFTTYDLDKSSYLNAREMAVSHAITGAFKGSNWKAHMADAEKGELTAHEASFIGRKEWTDSLTGEMAEMYQKVITLLVTVANCGMNGATNSVMCEEALTLYNSEEYAEYRNILAEEYAAYVLAGNGIVASGQFPVASQLKGHNDVYLIDGEAYYNDCKANGNPVQLAHTSSTLVPAGTWTEEKYLENLDRTTSTRDIRMYSDGTQGTKYPSTYFSDAKYNKQLLTGANTRSAYWYEKTIKGTPAEATYTERVVPNRIDLRRFIDEYQIEFTPKFKTHAGTAMPVENGTLEDVQSMLSRVKSVLTGLTGVVSCTFPVTTRTRSSGDGNGGTYGGDDDGDSQGDTSDGDASGSSGFA